MVEDFLEEQEQEEVYYKINKLARIAELEAELTKLKEG